MDSAIVANNAKPAKYDRQLKYHMKKKLRETAHDYQKKFNARVAIAIIAQNPKEACVYETNNDFEGFGDEFQKLEDQARVFPMFPGNAKPKPLPVPRRRLSKEGLKNLNDAKKKNLSAKRKTTLSSGKESAEEVYTVNIPVRNEVNQFNNAGLLIRTVSDTDVNHNGWLYHNMGLIPIVPSDTGMEMLGGEIFEGASAEEAASSSSGGQ